ncbi:MAG TPA: hypothetical protein VJY35_11915 [Candidatus Eisenbacteria bacterium]|nr:hypothetical protein [Candidatus Eisenbacteria bacterium]
MSSRVTAAMVVALLALALAPGAHAQKLQKGSTVVWIGVHGNKAQLIGPTTGAANIYEADEIGVHVAFSRFLSDQWAGVLSGSFAKGREAFTPTAGSEEKETSTSYSARLGFDRYAFIDDNVAIYAGPGLLYWSGRAKYEGSGIPSLDGDWPRVKQFGFNGRLGMYARLGSRAGLFGHIGQVLATNSADEAPGKNTWWTMHHEGSVGLAFDF